MERRADAGTIDRERPTAIDGDAPGRSQRAVEENRSDRATQDDGRGRSATKPAEIPARGWKDILLRVYEGISDNRILANAAGITFYGLLALFPAIAALVSIYGLFADPGTIAKELDAAKGMLPGGGLDIIRDQLTRLTSQGSGNPRHRLCGGSRDFAVERERRNQSTL